MRTVGPAAMTDAEWDQKRREFTGLIEQVINDGVQSGELHDPNPLLTALYIPGLVRSAMLYGPKGLQRDALVHHIVTLLQCGLRQMKDPEGECPARATVADERPSQT
jgi:hypothetical protein